jgi:hypothetical protein
MAALGATPLLALATALPESAARPRVPPAAALGAERERLLAWLAKNHAWQDVPFERLDVRLSMIRRLRFDRPAG